MQTVYAVYPGKMLRNLSGLVALQGADEMPFQVKIVQRCNFLDAFLCVIFAKLTLTRLCRLAYPFGMAGLAHRQQQYLCYISSAFIGRYGNALSYGLQVGADCCHNGKRVREKSRGNSRRIYLVKV